MTEPPTPMRRMPATIVPTSPAEAVNSFPTIGASFAPPNQTGDPMSM